MALHIDDILIRGRLQVTDADDLHAKADFGRPVFEEPALEAMVEAGVEANTPVAILLVVPLEQVQALVIAIRLVEQVWLAEVDAEAIELRARLGLNAKRLARAAE